MSEMKQAETFLEMVADCPYCGKSNMVELAYESEDYFEEWTCEICLKDFKYCHPENQYGLAK